MPVGAIENLEPRNLINDILACPTTSTTAAILARREQGERGEGQFENIYAPVNSISREGSAQTDTLTTGNNTPTMMP